MSYYGSDTILEDTRPDLAVAEGVVLQRRCFLRLSLATLAAAVGTAACGRSLTRAPSGASGRTVVPVEPAQNAPLATAPDGPTNGESPAQAPPATLEIAELIDELYPRARTLIDSGLRDDAAYLAGLRELLARLRVPTEARLGAAQRAAMDARGIRNRRTFGIGLFVFRFDAGKGFPHHDHRDYNGVILGLDGAVRIRNFDILGDDPVPPAGTTFQIRQTRDDRVTPGRFSSLALARDNVHDVVAGPDGARVLDAFTFFAPTAGSHNLDVAVVPRDPERRIFDAAWRG